MEISNLELTPDQRAALLAEPDAPVYIADETTQKVYMLWEQGRLPALDEEYIRAGLELAREQIDRGEVSNLTIQEIISKVARQTAS
jgi:hypothetical protein